MATPSTAMTVVKKNTPARYVDPRKTEYASGKRWLSSAASSSRSPFAGKQLKFNGQDGEIVEGFGKSAVVREENRYVMNIPNTLVAWQYWPEGEAPTWPAICAPFSGETLPSRREMGPDETKVNQLSDREEDVYSEHVILIMRDPETGELFNLPLKGAARFAALNFLAEAVDACERKPGKLPVVEIGSMKTKNKEGKGYKTPTFEIIGWEKITDSDMPAGIEASTEADEDADADEMPKASVKGRKAAPRDDEDDDAPARGKGRAALKAKVDAPADEDEPETSEDDEQPEEEDDRPAAKKSTSNGKSSTRRQAAEDDEDGEDWKKRVSAKAKQKAGVKDNDDDKGVVVRKRRAPIAD